MHDLYHENKSVSRGIVIQSARYLPETAQSKADGGAVHLGSLFDLASANECSVAARRNQTLIYEGDRSDIAYLVESGMLRTIKVLPDGRRQVLSFHEAGNVIGLLEADVHVCTVESVTTVRVKAANRLQLQVLLDRRPQWRSLVLSFAASELATARHRAVMLGRHSARERICSFLLHRPRCDGIVELQMPRKDIADYLGLTMETVSRILTQIETDGLIRRLGVYRIQIIDVNRMTAVEGF